MKVRYSIPALILTLALGSQPVQAQGHRGGGSRGGGSHGGGSHGGGSHGGYGGSAVARHPSAGSRYASAGGTHYGSRPGYATRGGLAEQRHPRAGSGHGYGYGYGYRPGYGHYGHSAYRPYYGYRPYYPYYPYYSYSPYYGSSYWPGVSLSFGWGYASSAPYYAGGYYESPGYSGVSDPYVAPRGDEGGAPPPPVRDAERSYEDRSGRVRLEVRPDDASVYVDDAFRGTAREARIMKLPPGRHVIELVRPGFAIEHREVTVVVGESQDVLVELVRP
jgi:hypothetical protein